MVTENIPIIMLKPGDRAYALVMPEFEHDSDPSDDWRQYALDMISSQPDRLDMALMSFTALSNVAIRENEPWNDYRLTYRLRMDLQNTFHASSEKIAAEILQAYFDRRRQTFVMDQSYRSRDSGTVLHTKDVTTLQNSMTLTEHGERDHWCCLTTARIITASKDVLLSYVRNTEKALYDFINKNFRAQQNAAMKSVKRYTSRLTREIQVI